MLNTASDTIKLAKKMDGGQAEEEEDKRGKFDKGRA